MFFNYFATTEHVSRLLRDHRTRLWLLDEQITLVYSFLRDHRTRYDLFCDYRTCLQLSNENKENLLLENQFTDVFWRRAFRAVSCVPRYKKNIFHNPSVCKNTVHSSAEICLRQDSLCDGLVTRSDEYYRVCVCVCDLETSKLGGLVPIWAVAPQNRTETVPGSLLPHQFQFIIYFILHSMRYLQRNSTD